MRSGVTNRQSADPSLARKSAGLSRKSAVPNKYDKLFRASMAVVAHQQQMEEDDEDGTTSGGETPRSRVGPGDDTAHGASSVASSKLASSKSGLEEAEAGTAGAAAAAAAAAADAAPKGSWFKRFFSKYGAFMLGVCVTQVGMICFNIGLTYGFTALGDQTGTTLPSAFLKVPYDSESPYYRCERDGSRGGGGGP